MASPTSFPLAGHCLGSADNPLRPGIACEEDWVVEQVLVFLSLPHDVERLPTFVVCWLLHLGFTPNPPSWAS
jgi:hypothetical protein